MNRRPFLATLALAPLGVLAACTDNEAGSTGGAIAVESTDDECKVASTEAPSGNLVFEVTNKGSQVTEFYLLAEDGLRIIGEVENIGPGLSRQLVVTVAPGTYVTACKPGMTGDGIRGDFTVTDSGGGGESSGELTDLLATATTQYALYVEEEAEELLEKTQQFADLYVGGDDDGARALYADARTHWERIEPVAESFGDLDPRLDLREADLAEGEAWTGWHRIEKDLWPPADGYTAAAQDEREALAGQLVADTEELVERVEQLTYTPDQLGNGAKELLDRHRDGDGFVLYDELTAEQVKELSDAVNALSEPLSRLTAAVVL